MRSTNACFQHEIIFAVASNENMHSQKPENQLGAHHCAERPIQTHSNSAPKGSLEIHQEQTARLALLWVNLGWFSWNSAEKHRCMKQICWILDAWQQLGTDADWQVLPVRAGEDFWEVSWPYLVLGSEIFLDHRTLTWLLEFDHVFIHITSNLYFLTKPKWFFLY